MVKTVVTQEDRELIKHRYLTLGWGRARCGIDLGIGEKIVKRVLEEEGVTLRTKSGSGPQKSKYKMNNNYLQTQGRNQAYFIGLIASDGNISSSDNRVELELASVDLPILEQLRQELELEREIKIYETSSGYVKNKLYFYSAQIKRDLISYGVVPNKTYSKSFSFPKKMQKEYIIDYIRGYFDGDGSVKPSGSNNRPAFQIDGTQLHVLQDMQKYFKEVHSLELRITKQSKTNVQLYRLYCYADTAEKVFELMYKDKEETLYLTRKYDKYKTLLDKYYN